MAYLPDTVRNRYLSNMSFQCFNANTITDREVYLRELDEVRKKGYALDNEEEMSGVVCIGAAILDYTGFPSGAIWISGPKDRLPESIREESALVIMKYAKMISSELGFRPRLID